MAKFKSRYSGLGFYVNGSLRRFKNGVYVTNDKEEIAVLEKLSDVKRVDKPAKAGETESKAAEPKEPAEAKKKSSAEK